MRYAICTGIYCNKCIYYCIRNRILCAVLAQITNLQVNVVLEFSVTVRSELVEAESMSGGTARVSYMYRISLFLFKGQD